MNLRLFITLFVLTLFFACKNDHKNTPDVSNIKVETDFSRFEKDLFAMDTLQLLPATQNLQRKYPDFFNTYLYDVMGYKNQDTSTLAQGKFLSGFINYPSARKLYDTCMVVYNLTNDIQQAFNQSFKYYKYYFPNNPIPKVVTCISEFRYGNFTAGEAKAPILGVGLDFFMGEKFSPYKSIFPDYIARGLTKEHLVSKSLEGFLTNDLAGIPKENRLLDMMLHNGKILYALDCLLPNTPDSIKIGYTTKQINWCQENEFPLWNHLISNNLLYSSKLDEINKLINYSPFGPSGMPQEAPGRTANWLGWQIVKAYMLRNPNTSLEQLFALKDAQQILDAAKYKPKR